MDGVDWRKVTVKLETSFSAKSTTSYVANDDSKIRKLYYNNHKPFNFTKNSENFKRYLYSRSFITFISERSRTGPSFPWVRRFWRVDAPPSLSTRNLVAGGLWIRTCGLMAGRTLVIRTRPECGQAVIRLGEAETSGVHQEQERCRRRRAVVRQTNGPINAA